MRFLFMVFGFILCTVSLAEEPVVSTFVTIQATAGMSVAEDGTLYVADFGDINTLAGTSLFKVTPDGQMALITDQLVQGPSGNLIDSDGSILQSIYLTNRIVRVSQEGTISSFAEGVPNPDDLVMDSDGNVFAATCPFSGPLPGIYRITPDGQVSLLVEDPQFGCLSGITMDDNGDLYAASFSSGIVFRVAADGSFSQFAQLPSPSSHIKFANNEFYVMMPRANQIARVDREGNVSILAGTGEAGTVDGLASQAQFDFPFHLEVSPDGRFIFVSGGPNGDSQANPIRMIDLFPEQGAVIPPRLRAITGTWFDPQRDGEGMMIQAIAGRDQVWLYWASYDDQGNQRWYIGVGDIVGDQVIFEMMQSTEGGVFGQPFDPDQVQRFAVGTTTITMPDCERLIFEFDINGVVGIYELERVFGLDGQECV